MRTSLCLAMSLLLTPISACASSPWQQHGKLEVSENGHRIQYEDETPFLWIGDTAWGLFQQLTREEVDLYLDHRKELGFTVIQSVAFWYPHGGGLPNGPHNATNAYGHRPFSGEDDAPNTSEPLIVDGGSSSDPNDYWDHADYVINAIEKRGMHLALLPCWGRAYVTPQFSGAHPEFTAEEAKKYGAFLGERYKNYPNIIWVIGGDAKPEIAPDENNPSAQSYDHKDIFRAMAEGIALGTTQKQLSWNQPDKAWDEIFMTYHPDGDVPYNSSSWFHNDAWLDANGVEVWKEVDHVFSTMLRDYQLSSPAKPSLFLEGSYEYGSYQHGCGWVTPLRARRQAYHTFFAGGAGHTYGAGPIWAMRGTDGDYNCGHTWQEALDFPAAFQLASIAKQFLIDHNWHDWIPDDSLITGPKEEGENLKSGVSSPQHEIALVYFTNTSSTDVKNTASYPASAQWFDPRNGNKQDAGNFQIGQERSMTPPKEWEDAILILEKD
ncbi:DUF4038 domain-containing protein [Hirschia litorea]|uniref:DUF4038 domain-containing protein n=1 Tax=Hirschia litorea TaxID=1199156 RepID=A0ABW2IGV6_9PROT